MRIRNRINCLVLTLLLSMIGASSFSLIELSKVENEIQKITSSNLELKEDASALQYLQLEQAVNFERVLRFASELDSKQESSNIPMQEAKEEFLRISSSIKGILDTDSRELSSLKPFYLSYEKQAKGIFKKIAEDNLEAAYLDAFSITLEEANLRSEIQELKNKIDQAAKNSATRAAKVQARAYRVVLGITIFSVVLGFSLAIFIARTITKPLEQAVNLAKEISEGKTTNTQKKQRDDELGELLSAMQKMASSVEQSETALRARASELARSNADLEQFAYIASHDLQEPLRMVSSYTQLLSKRYKGKLDESADEFIGFAVDGVNRMKRLINDLLLYSRLGRSDERQVEVDLNQVLKSVLSTLRTSIEETRAELTCSQLPSVIGNSTKLEQLLQNLISNALKFKSQNSAKIEISCKESPTSYTLCVKDNGIGIDPAYREKVFQIFQRLHGKSEYPGTGIGLAICKRIVEFHKGQIWIESELGCGSSFFIELPKEDLR